MFILSLSCYAVLIFCLHVKHPASLILSFIALLSLATYHFLFLNSKYEYSPDALFSPNRIIFFAWDVVIRAHKDFDVSVNYVRLVDVHV